VVVECLPLSQALALGTLGWPVAGAVLYLAVMGAGAVVIALRRLTAALSP
jgi:hypothetical protein